MTTAELRGLTNQPPLLACSEIVFVDEQGNRLEVKKLDTVTGRDEDGKVTKIPYAIITLKRVYPE